jgi:hypothetical protein
MNRHLLLLAAVALLGLQLTLGGCCFHHRHHHGDGGKPCRCDCPCPQAAPAPEK